MGLQSHFQWFTQLTKIKYPTRYCKSWTISPDAKTYTFTLRKDIYFQKHILFGKTVRTVNASDFEYSLNRLFDEKSSPGGWVLQNVESFKAK
jgi:peptide/nickel transport system substrate-binding protein